MKGFVISKADDLFSNSLADECIDSAKQFNVQIEKFNGIYSDIDILLKKESLFLNPSAVKKINTNGIKGCFLSHYFLWKKCVELDHPILIFEYDALMVNPLPDKVIDLFDDCLNLDYTRHLYLKDIDIYESKIIKSNDITISKLKPTDITNYSFKFINKNHIKGAFGYLIKPFGAKKIIDNIKKYGILPADVAINLAYCDLYYTTPSIARLNPKMLSNIRKYSHTKKNF